MNSYIYRRCNDKCIETERLLFSLHICNNFPRSPSLDLSSHKLEDLSLELVKTLSGLDICGLHLSMDKFT